MFPTALRSLMVSALLGVGTSAVCAQTTFFACRVPGVNAIYMIKFGTGSPQACLDASHVEFSWLEGGAPSAGSITSTHIADATIATADIADGAITQAKIGAAVSLPLADGAVTSASIADGAIATADVADAAITQAKLHPTVSVPPPNNTVTSTSIVDGAILAADIATDAVTNEKIAAGAVASGEVLDNSLTSADIATDAVGFAELAANSVGTSENGREVIEVVIADARTTDFIGGYAICPGGKVAVGGGHHVRSWVPSASQDVALTGSEPVTNGWWVALYDPVPYGILEIGVFAVCVNN